MHGRRPPRLRATSLEGRLTRSIEADGLSASSKPPAIMIDESARIEIAPTPFGHDATFRLLASARNGAPDDDEPPASDTP